MTPCTELHRERNSVANQFATAVTNVLVWFQFPQGAQSSKFFHCLFHIVYILATCSPKDTVLEYCLIILVAVWSGVNIAGVRLRDLSPLVGQVDDPENWHELHKQVVESAYEVIRLKGYTSWAIGLSTANLCSAVLRNVGSIHAVSTLVQVTILLP